MRILVINPNTSEKMTKKIALTANSVASHGTEIIALNSAHGPSSIEGYYDEAISIPGMLETIKNVSNIDAIVIACFDDTGLNAVRCMTDKPVIGIGEAAFHTATMLANKFSVVTTLARSVPALEHNLLTYGMDRKCVRVRSSEVSVSALEAHNPEAVALICKQIEIAIESDRAEAIVLGCAGMTDLVNMLINKYGLPVLDGVSCAVSLCESLVRLGLKTSRLGGYAAAVEKM